MPAYPDHQDLRPAYVQATDPGAVGAGVFWLDTAGGSGTWTLRVRNDANTGWESVAAIPVGAAGGDLSGTYPNPSVVDDSHAHTGATISGITDADIAANAEILVSKLADGAADDVLLTNADGVTVNWGKISNANIDAAAAIAMTKTANYSESTYTPQLDQGASTNIAKTVTKAKYTRIGNMIIGSVRLDITGTGTAGAQITVTLPVALAAGFNGVAIGAGQYYDASAAQNYAGTIFPSSGTQVYVSADQQSGNGVGLTPNIAVASGDAINFMFAYPVS